MKKLRTKEPQTEYYFAYFEYAEWYTCMHLASSGCIINIDYDMYTSVMWWGLINLTGLRVIILSAQEDVMKSFIKLKTNRSD